MSFEDYRDEIPYSIRQDITRLREYETEIGRLQAQLENAKREYQHLERVLKPYRKDYVETNNQRALIHRLPNEIFYMILEEALLKNHWRIRTLLTVCRYWHQFIMNSPKLWARIEIPSGFDLFNRYAKPSLAPYIESCYHHSKTLPMNISLTLYDLPNGVSYVRGEMLACLQGLVGHSQDPYDLEEYSDLLNAIDGVEEDYECPRYSAQLTDILVPLTGIEGERLQRWEYLTLSLPYAMLVDLPLAEFVWDKIKLVTDHLKGFHVDTGEWWAQEDWPLDAFPSFPSVNSFSVPRAACPSFFKLTPTKLRRLDIWVSSNYGNLLELTQFANLQDLCLDLRAYPPRTTISPTFTLHLPRLQYLEMQGYQYHITMNITFDLPSLYSLKITSSDGLEQMPGISPSQITWQDWSFMEGSTISASISALYSIAQSLSILYLRNLLEMEDEILDEIRRCRERGHFQSLRRIYRQPLFHMSFGAVEGIPTQRPAIEF